jgi:hypothetical protein
MNRRSASRLAGSPPTGNRPGLAGWVLLAASLATVVSGAGAARWGSCWYLRLGLHTPPGIVVHHSATDNHAGGKAIDAQAIDQAHEKRGWGIESGGKTYHIGYHYVILPTGEVQEGRPEWLPGAHTVGHNDMLGICLVGNFELTKPTPAQTRAAVELIAHLMRKYGIKASQVHAHRDFAQTACPGRNVDVVALAQQAEELTRKH